MNDITFRPNNTFNGMISNLNRIAFTQNATNKMNAYFARSAIFQNDGVAIVCGSDTVMCVWASERRVHTKSLNGYPCEFTTAQLKITSGQNMKRKATSALTNVTTNKHIYNISNDVCHNGEHAPQIDKLVVLAYILCVSIV